MANYAYIVGVCTKYLPELTALLNSLDYVGNKFDFHILGLDNDRSKTGLPEEFVSQFGKLNYKVIHHAMTNEEIEASRGISEIACRKRYWYTGEIGKNYDAICVLDADLVFVRNPWQYFEIAHKTGFILGPCKEQNKVYDHEHHQADGKWIIPKGYWNDKDLCNCPLFIDAKIWEAPLKKSWDIFLNHGFKAPDMDAMNICFIKAGAKDKIVKLAGLQWLGTNEQHLKPYIRVVLKKDNKIWTESGIELFTYHGQYYKDKWRKCQLDNRSWCAKHYLKTNLDDQAAGAMNVLYSYFKEMLDYKIKIEKKIYVPN